MAYRIAAIALGPLLLAQGLGVRRRVPRLPEPPGARRGRSGNGPSLRLLVLGDSAAAGVGAAHQDEALLGQLVGRLAPHFSVDWRLLARTGATTANTIDALDALRGERFDVVLTSLGVNDVTSGVRTATWRQQQAQLRRRLVDEFGARVVLISGVPPMSGFPALPQPLRWVLGTRAARFSAQLEQDVHGAPACRFLQLDFSDDAALMAHDGFHPGPRVYALWAEAAAARILAARQ